MKKISYHTKNKLVLPVAVVVLAVCYLLAIRQTVSAISTHRSLTRAAASINDLSESPEYLRSRLQEMDRTLSSYRVDTATWSDDFWLTLSGAARRKGLEVVFTPNRDVATSDSLGRIRTAAISFKGGYSKLVSMLDSAERSKGIGKPVYLKFAKENDPSRQGKEKLGLYVLFGGVAK